MGKEKIRKHHIGMSNEVYHVLSIKFSMQEEITNFDEFVDKVTKKRKCNNCARIFTSCSAAHRRCTDCQYMMRTGQEFQEWKCWLHPPRE